MKVVFSPHADDAIFSVGSYLSNRRDVTIVSPMAGIPSDEAGRRKHETLRLEHQSACKVIGAQVVNGRFLDDVYPAPSRCDVKAWMGEFFTDYTEVFIPFGIHHPDHVMVSNLLVSLLDTLPSKRVWFYEELPYRVDYPEIANIRFTHLENTVGRLRMLEEFTDDTVKLQAVQEYRSQIVGGEILNRVMVRERIWELIR